MRDIICDICEIGEKSYYVWKNKSHKKLIELIEKYFTKEDLQEFLQTGKIKKYDIIKNYNYDELLELLNTDKKEDISSFEEYLIYNFNLKKGNILKLENQLKNLEKIILKISKEIFLKEKLTPKNAKEKTINYIKSLKPTLKGFIPLSDEVNIFTKKDLINLFEKYYSSIEIYVLLKYTKLIFEINKE